MKLHWKFLFFTFGLPTLALLVFLVVADDFFTTDKTQTLSENNFTLATTIAQQLDPNDWKKASLLLSKIPLVDGLVFDPDGLIVASARREWLGLPLEKLIPPASAQTLQRYPAAEGSFQGPGRSGQPSFHHFIRLPAQTGTLLLMTPQTIVARPSLLLLMKFGWVFSLIFLMAFGASLWFRRAIATPLEMISDHTKNMATGHWNICLPDLGTDEFGKLGQRFNTMVQRIRQAIDEHQQQAQDTLKRSWIEESQMLLKTNTEHHDAHLDLISHRKVTEGDDHYWWYSKDQGSRLILLLMHFPGSSPQTTLIASAVRSAFSLIASSFVSVPLAMERLNFMIHDLLQGKETVPALMVVIDKASGVLTYCNLGFQRPLVLQKNNQEKRLLATNDESLDDLPILHGKPLGHQSEASFRESSYVLTAPSALIFPLEIASPATKGLLAAEFSTFLREHDVPVSDLVGDLGVLQKNWSDAVNFYFKESKTKETSSSVFVRWRPDAKLS